MRNCLNSLAKPIKPSTSQAPPTAPLLSPATGCSGPHSRPHVHLVHFYFSDSCHIIVSIPNALPTSPSSAISLTFHSEEPAPEKSSLIPNQISVPLPSEATTCCWYFKTILPHLVMTIMQSEKPAGSSFKIFPESGHFPPLPMLHPSASHHILRWDVYSCVLLTVLPTSTPASAPTRSVPIECSYIFLRLYRSSAQKSSSE